MKLPKIPRRFLPLAALILVLLFIMPRTAKFGYDYKKGSPWPYETLIAQFDFPVLKTEDQILEERESAGSVIIPYYRFSEETVGETVKAVEGLDLGKYSSLKGEIIAKIGEIYNKGIISDAKVKVIKGSADVSKDVIFIQRGKRAEKHPVTEVYKVSAAENKLLSDISARHPEVNVDSLLSKGGVYELLAPNLSYDRTTTELVHAGSSDYISPTQGYVAKDRKIVSQGEIVTADIAQMLDSYKAEYNKTYGYGKPRVLLWLGNLLLAIVLVVILYFSIYYTNPKIFSDKARYSYLLTVFLLAAVSAFLTDKLPQTLVYLMPFYIFALFLQSFFSTRVVLPVYVVSLLPLLIFSGSGVELFIMHLSAGVVGVYMVRYFGKSWRQFILAATVFLVLLVTHVAFRLTDTVAKSNFFRTAMYLGLGCFIAVGLYQLIYLFEKMFNLVSTNRLNELADTNNSLLRELSQKAPGTFQHCLQVMGMADAAARSIDADVALVRAGALYHDIGKMANPLCFIENENLVPGGAHYHESLTAEESARQIIRHVTDGVEIASKNGLPDVIKDFIRTHHGTSKTGYFYGRYLQEGGDPENAAAFTYPGPNPVTKEQTVLMLCDSLEAASRTLKENTPEAYSEFVESIVDGKMKQGQFSEADISVREIGIVKEVMKDYLRQMYHERIEYPK